MGLVLNLILCMVLLLTPYLVLQVLHMQPIRLLQVLHLYLSNLVSKFPRKYARKSRSKPTSRLPGSSVVMFLTKSVPRLRRKLVPSDRDLSRSSPTRGSVPSNTGRSVRTSRTSRSNVSQVQDEECYSTSKLQCLQLPKNVQETTHTEQCSTEYDTECSIKFENKCEPVMERKCVTNLIADCQVTYKQ